MSYNPGIAFNNVRELLPTALLKMNTFSSEVLKTRGGRIGSGMGALLEALWGYMMNQALSEKGCDLEIAWFTNNQYNDFACLEKGALWDEESRAGELFRIEAKSMNTGADESKAHFDVLHSELHEYDSFLILVWEWKNIGHNYFSPQIIDTFLMLQCQSCYSVTNYIKRGAEVLSMPIHALMVALRKTARIMENPSTPQEKEKGFVVQK